MMFMEGPISWLADNQQKGISKVPAVTIHGAAVFSEQHWDSDRKESGSLLLEAAQPWLGAGVSEFEVHAWRYAKPLAITLFSRVVATYLLFSPIGVASESGPSALFAPLLAALAIGNAVIWGLAARRPATA